METISLDFSGCKYAHDVHMVIKDALDFSDCYGENLDALWDFLNHYTNDDLCVQCKGISSLSSELQDYMIKIIDVFNDVNKSTPNITFKIIH